jgi:hypothetical protein
MLKGRIVVLGINYQDGITEPPSHDRFDRAVQSISQWASVPMKMKAVSRVHPDRRIPESRRDPTCYSPYRCVGMHYRITPFTNQPRQMRRRSHVVGMDRRPLKREVMHDVRVREHLLTVSRNTTGDLDMKACGSQGVELRKHEAKHDVHGSDIEYSRLCLLFDGHFPSLLVYSRGFQL